MSFLYHIPGTFISPDYLQIKPLHITALAKINNLKHRTEDDSQR